MLVENEHLLPPSIGEIPPAQHEAAHVGQGAVGGGLAQIVRQVAVQTLEGQGLEEAAGAHAPLGELEHFEADFFDCRSRHIGIGDGRFGRFRAVGVGAGGVPGGGLQPVPATFQGQGHFAQPLALIRVVGAAQVAQKGAGFFKNRLRAAQLHGGKADGPAAESGLLVIGIGRADEIGGTNFQPRQIGPEAGGGPHAQRLPEGAVQLRRLAVGGQHE